MLQEQAGRAHALLLQQHEQQVDMQKRLTLQQRRAIRLQGEVRLACPAPPGQAAHFLAPRPQVHAARLITTERGRMQEAVEQVRS